MGRELAEPDWLPLTDDELRGILGRSHPGGLGRAPIVTWRSPRPTSAAALVRHGDLAYDYLIGHARWFGQPPGAALLGFLDGHLRG